jgi:hypothetical protein
MRARHPWGGGNVRESRAPRPWDDGAGRAEREDPHNRARRTSREAGVLNVAGARGRVTSP